MITPHSRSTDRSTIESLIAALGSRDGLKRQDARAELIGRGHECITDLIHALKHPQEQVRWEAAKALVTIADPAATAALVDALSDQDSDVRWLAAEGLIALGRDSIWPVLERLTQRAGSEKFREAAHHVLHAHFDGELDELLAPVLGALDGPSPETGAPVAAYEALRDARRGNLPFGVDDG
jgi:HEAT repeat protein